MNLIRHPKGLVSIITAIQRREKAGQLVTRINISPALHHQLMSEVWEWDGRDVDYIDYIMNIPVDIIMNLPDNNFYLETEQGSYRNDA